MPKAHHRSRESCLCPKMAGFPSTLTVIGALNVLTWISEEACHVPCIHWACSECLPATWSASRGVLSESSSLIFISFTKASSPLLGIKPALLPHHFLKKEFISKVFTVILSVTVEMSEFPGIGQNYSKSWMLFSFTAKSAFTVFLSADRITVN